MTTTSILDESGVMCALRGNVKWRNIQASCSCCLLGWK